MESIDKTCTEIPEIFTLSESYETLFSENTSDNEQSILNLSRRLSTIHEFPYSNNSNTVSLSNTIEMDDLSMAALEHLLSTDESQIMGSVSDVITSDSLPDVSDLSLNMTTTTTTKQHKNIAQV